LRHWIILVLVACVWLGGGPPIRAQIQGISPQAPYPPPAAFGSGFQPNRLDMRRMWVFSAGIHKFQDDHLHPGRESVVTQDIGLVRALIDRGLPQNQIVALRDEQATTQNCKAQLQWLISQARPGDFLLVFIHSHGSLRQGGLICTYETGGTWDFGDLIQQIESGFPGSQACVCVGACHSGSLLSLIKSAPRRVAYFGVTSVHPQLSALTVATSDFEAGIRDAFDGSPCPDLNGDGVTTFGEFGSYITHDQSVLFGTTPEVSWTDTFDPQMIIGQARSRDGDLDCILVQLPDATRGRIIRQEGNKVLVRGSKNPSAVEWTDRNQIRRLD
jgi:hypothetical protein